MTFTLIRFRSTASTQAWARDWARLGAREGLVVQALEQTAGRGRLQRSWHSPYNDGLYLSVLLRPAIPLAQASHLTMLVSMAAIEACQAVAGVSPVPKWPNDLLLRGRKLAGVLTELGSQAEWSRNRQQITINDGGGSPQAMAGFPVQNTKIRTGYCLSYAVIGLGLNVNTDFEGTSLAETAISLQQVVDHSVKLPVLRDAYLNALAKRYRHFLSGESPVPDWKAQLEPIGRHVRVAQPGQAIVEGMAVDVNTAGALLVQDQTGVTHTIWAGDVITINSQPHD